MGVEGGLEPGERFERSVGARAFIDGKNGGGGFQSGRARPSPLETMLLRTSTGTISSCEFSGGDGGQGFLMALVGKLVGLLAGDGVFAREIFGGEAHAEIGVGIVIHEPGIGRDLVATHRHHAHGLGAASDDHVGMAAHDALGGHGDGLQARGAEAVDGHRRKLDGQAGAQGRDARDVHALLGFGHGAAEDHVVNFFGIEVWNAVERTAYGDGGEVVGAGGMEGALAGLADGSAN